MSLITNSRRLFVIAAVLAGRCLVASADVSSDAPPTARRLGPGPRPGTRVMEGYRLVEAAAPEQANGTISLAFDEQAALFTCSSRRVGICVPDNRLKGLRSAALYGSHLMLAHESLLLNEGQGGVVHAPGAGVGGKRRQDAGSEALWLAQPASSECRAFHKPGFARRPSAGADAGTAATARKP